MVQLMPLHPGTPSSLASFKSRLVLPFSYQLTQVVLEKRPLNGRSSNSNSSSYPGFLRNSINFLFHRLSQQKLNAIMTVIKGHSTLTPVPSILADNYWTKSLLRDHSDPVYSVNSCFAQIFEWRTKTTLFVTIFPRVSMFREIHEFSRFVVSRC